MHEMFMAEQVAKEIEKVIAQYQPVKVMRIGLKVGALRQAVPDLLQFAVHVALQETVAADAEIAVEQVTAQCHCNKCGTDFTVSEWIYLCPKCESGNVTSQGGDELLIETISMETPEPVVGGH